MKRTDIQWQIYYYPVGSSRLKYYAMYETRAGARAVVDRWKQHPENRKAVVVRYVPAS